MNSVLDVVPFLGISEMPISNMLQIVSDAHDVCTKRHISLYVCS
jgi:hypothetical protein